MGDEWLNDLMICYTKKQIFRSIRDEKIIQHFEEMKERQMLVPHKKLVVMKNNRRLAFNTIYWALLSDLNRT
uniref:Uncharacterized protein n=1 Tax=Oryza brachyantha TaxID=4533 RepID=J3LW75_ORYBR